MTTLNFTRKPLNFTQKSPHTVRVRSRSLFGSLARVRREGGSGFLWIDRLEKVRAEALEYGMTEMADEITARLKEYDRI